MIKIKTYLKFHSFLYYVGCKLWATCSFIYSKLAFEKWTTPGTKSGVFRYCTFIRVQYRNVVWLASWSLRSRITGSALKLNLQCQNWKLFGKKTWNIFGANLLHPNFGLSNITGCFFWLWLFHAKLGYYLLQHFFK